MRIPHASAWLVAFGVASGACWAEDAAHATACSSEIARLEMVLGQAQPDRQVVASAPESRAARLHHQPTPNTVATAETEAKEKLDAALALARKLDSERKDSECIAALEKVAVPLGVH
jgi:hypothetical protein